MNTKVRNVVTLALAVAVTASLFVGCGGDKGSASVPASSVSLDQEFNTPLANAKGVLNRWVASEEVQTALKEANSKAAEGLTLTEETIFGGQVGVYADEEGNRYFIANGEKYPADTLPTDLIIRNYDTLRKVTITNQTQMNPWLSNYGQFEEDMKQSEAKPYLDRVSGESSHYFSQSMVYADTPASGGTHQSSAQGEVVTHSPVGASTLR